jgi:3-methyladenine DNA glycosylase AlkC
MGDFKDEGSVELAGRLASELTTAWPEFPHRRFVRGLGPVLDPLGLMARVQVLADRLAGALPDEFASAADVLWRALESPTFTGWMTLPCGYFVAHAGIEQPAIGLPLLAGLTPRWSSEGPIRPFIERHPEVTYEHLHRWVTDPDEHVRRLVSEGTRPRLPWAPQLRRLISDPTPNIELLERLVEDPSDYVRRSVANHLNDIAKDHPDVALELARAWRDRGERGAWVVRHGLRMLVKQGQPDALRLLGATPEAPVRLRALSVDRDTIAIGDEVVLTFTLEVDATQDAEAVIDYRVHYMGVNGRRAPKVFKLTRRRLVPGQPITVTARHAFKHVSIRQIHPGRHTLDVQVNGRVLGGVDIEVLDGDVSPGQHRPARPETGRVTGAEQLSQ